MRYPRRRTQRGSILVGILACLVIVMGLALTMVQSALQARREVRVQSRLRQTRFVLDAGVMRAVAQLQASEEYSGETWEPKVDLPYQDRITVEITVKPSEEESSSKRIQVTARVGSDEPHTVVTQRTHEFTLHLSETSKEG